MEDKVLLSVRETEEKSRTIVSDAHKQADKAITEAKSKSMAIIKETQSQTASLSELKAKDRAKAIEQEKKAILSDGGKKSLQLEKEANKNIKKAADVILRYFEESVTKA